MEFRSDSVSEEISLSSASSKGRVITKVLPIPGVLVISMLPPICSNNALAMLIPSPVP